jgi:hypothetical protein
MNCTAERRHGFTLIELTIASSLTILIALMLSTSWFMLNRPTHSLIAWGQLFQEMDIATNMLARDLGGCLPDYVNIQGQLGIKSEALLWKCERINDLADGFLRLHFDANSTVVSPSNDPDDPGDYKVDYYLDDDHKTLVRRKWYTSSGDPISVVNVASNLEKMEVDYLLPDMTTVTDDAEAAPFLRIRLTFQFPNYYPKDETTPLTRTCVLVIKKNP